MKVTAVLLAAGKGRRIGEKKQFIKLKGEPVFQYSLNTINKVDLISEIVLVLPEEDIDRVKIFSFKNVIKVPGGRERQESVYNALRSIESTDIVVIHDSARPFATERMFIDGIKNVKSGWDGSITALKARDTVKRVRDKKVVQTLNREELYIVQTPQAFDYKKVLDAHEKAVRDKIFGTDDAFLMEKYGYSITVNEGSVLNFKITTKEDMILANCLAKGKTPF
ncbi:2-C-methyl-D-erythritol 4-phosphate cytidylyltransferase [Persephonella sp.]